MNFVYDKAKSARNLEKHGIDFEHAQELWKKTTFIFPKKDSVSEYGEMRYLVLGEIDSRPTVAVVSYRGTSIRINQRARLQRRGKKRV
jgi:uncharacterized DUF497 family protein